MELVIAQHRFDKIDGQPVTREFTMKTWNRLLSVNIDGKVYPKQGFIILRGSDASDIKPKGEKTVEKPKGEKTVEKPKGEKTVDQMNAKELIAYAKEKGYEINDSQSKALILEEVKAFDAKAIEDAAKKEDSDKPEA
jgi:hypothetical protein